MFTPKGNIPVVAGYLQQSGLLLDHPTLSSDLQRLTGQHYHNPHNPPPGGHKAAMMGAGSGIYPARGNGMNRFNTSVSGKSVEVQRSQVDQLFKSLKDGEELEECEARACILLFLVPRDVDVYNVVQRRRWLHLFTPTRRKPSLSSWNAKGSSAGGTVPTLHYGRKG